MRKRKLYSSYFNLLTINLLQSPYQHEKKKKKKEKDFNGARYIFSKISYAEIINT